MFGIKVNGTFLDIKPGASAEIERQSPFFAINEAYKEASTPITIPYTEANALALGLIYQYYTERQKKKVEAELYDGNTFECKCLLIVETGRMNLNRLEDSELTGYVLFGISQFYQLTKGKFLHQLVLGGIRNFSFTTNNPNDGSNGYWQHFHKTWTDETIPYVMQPVRNDGYYGEDGNVEWMNKLGNDAKLAYDLSSVNVSPIVPMIRLKYLLECIFNEHGFTIDFSGLNDDDWKRILLINLTYIDWVTFADDPVTNEIVPTPKPLIQIDLRNHVPQNKTISDFLVQLFFKYGWAPVFDFTKRRCRLVAGKELGKGSIKKDWTYFAEPHVDTAFNEDEKIFGFSNEIDSNDEMPLEGDFTNIKYGSPVLYYTSLSAPSAAIAGRITFVYEENRYYQVQLNEAGTTYVWAPFSDNIFDDNPESATDTISTTISTLPVYFSLYRSSGGTDYYGYFPAMRQAFNTPVGFRTLLYHGMVKEQTAAHLQGVLSYPYASNHKVNPDGLIVAWSNTLHHVLPIGAQTDYGIIPYWWTAFLRILQAGEEVDFKLWLPLHEMASFAWDDEILIGNISYLVKSILKPLPYNGFIVAKMKRLVKKIPVVIPGTGGGSGSGGTGGGTVVIVYARLQIINIRTIPLGPLPQPQKCDLKVSLYTDAAGTVPYTPPTSINVLLRKAEQATGSTIENNVTTDYYAVTQAEQVILKDVYYKRDVLAGSGVIMVNWHYTLLRNAANDYVVI